MKKIVFALVLMSASMAHATSFKDAMKSMKGSMKCVVSIITKQSTLFQGCDDLATEVDVLVEGLQNADKSVESEFDASTKDRANVIKDVHQRIADELKLVLILKGEVAKKNPVTEQSALDDIVKLEKGSHDKYKTD